MCNNNSSSRSPESTNSGIPCPNASFRPFDHLSPSHISFSISVTKSTKPKTYREACQSKHWLESMNVELEALAKNGSW